VDQDIGLLGERNWRSLALNREEWKKLLKKAQGPHRVVDPMIMMVVVVVVVV
jgi:hypothetical protein